MLLAGLRTLCAGGRHVFWPASVSLFDTKLFEPSCLAGPRHVTDIHLLGLATKMGGTLATFERTIPLAAVVGATRARLDTIAPSDGAAEAG